MSKILTTLFSLLFLAAPSLGHAQASLGKKLELLKSASGKPSFGLQYALNPDKMVAITFSVQGNQLVGTTPAAVSPVFWTVVNKESMTQLTGWQSANFGHGQVLPGSTQAMTLSISNPAEVISVAKSLGKIALVISLNSTNPVPSAYVDLSDLCASNPEQFLNLDTFSSGCK